MSERLKAERWTHGTRPVQTWRDIRSVARLSAPMHPIFVHFTIALTSASFAFDFFSWILLWPSFRHAGWWCLVGSVFFTLLTIASGVVSRIRLPMREGEARSFLRTHMALGPIFFGVLVMVAIWRGRLWETQQEVSGFYLLAMACVVFLMTLQGYLGGELVYRYGAEVEAK